MTSKRHDIKLSLSFDRVKKIALTGISRAVNFSKLASTSEHDYQKFSSHKKDQIIQFNISGEIPEDGFPEWLSSYQNWVNCNSVNEIIEAFLTFLEFVVVVTQMHGERIEVKAGDKIDSIISKRVREIRRKYPSYNNIKQYFEATGNEIISSDDDDVIKSLMGIRNTVTHNRGVIEERSEFVIDGENVVLKWFKPDFFIKLESGKEIPVSGEPMPEPGFVGLRPRGLKTKHFLMSSSVEFDFEDVEEIGWTFLLLVEDISKRVSNALLS